MEIARLEHLTRTLATLFSRRTLAGALGLSALEFPSLIEAKQKRKRKKKRKKIKRNSFGCVNIGNACKNSEQCCSGICEGKKDKKKCRGHDVGACQADQDVCDEGFPTCGTAGLCFRTTGQASFCGQAATCLDCQTDAECQAQFGPGAACVVCNDCQNAGTTGCSEIAS